MTLADMTELGRVHVDLALRLAEIAGEVGAYCDHVEHCEHTHPSVIRTAGADLRKLTVDTAEQLDVDVFDAYALRLDQIERRNPLFRDGLEAFFAVGRDSLRADVQAASNWRELQLIQIEHDRNFHPDVIGMSKYEQTRHYAFHLAKLAGIFAAAARGSVRAEDPEKLHGSRLPDMLLFGLKLATVTGEKLSSEPLPRPGTDLRTRILAA